MIKFIVGFGLGAGFGIYLWPFMRYVIAGW